MHNYHKTHKCLIWCLWCLLTKLSANSVHLGALPCTCCMAACRIVCTAWQDKHCKPRRENFHKDSPCIFRPWANLIEQKCTIQRGKSSCLANLSGMSCEHFASERQNITSYQLIFLACKGKPLIYLISSDWSIIWLLSFDCYHLMPFCCVSSRSRCLTTFRMVLKYSLNFLELCSVIWCFHNSGCLCSLRRLGPVMQGSSAPEVILPIPGCPVQVIKPSHSTIVHIELLLSWHITRRYMLPNKPCQQSTVHHLPMQILKASLQTNVMVKVMEVWLGLCLQCAASCIKGLGKIRMKKQGWAHQASNSNDLSCFIFRFRILIYKHITVGPVSQCAQSALPEMRKGQSMATEFHSGGSA